MNVRRIWRERRPDANETLSSAEALELTAEETFDVALDFGARDLPAGRGEGFVLLREDFADDSARVVPLVDDLIEHARIGVLRCYAKADQLKAHVGHLRDDFRDVGKPPAAEDVEVAEFSR